MRRKCVHLSLLFFWSLFFSKKVVLLFVLMMLGELKSGGVKLVEISCWLWKERTVLFAIEKLSMVLLSCCWFNGDGSGDSSFLDYFVK